MLLRISGKGSPERKEGSSQLPSFTLPVFVGSRTGRWLGAEVAPDGTLGILYNNLNHVPGSRAVSLNEWHRALVTDEGESDEAFLYLGGELSCMATFAIEPVNAKNVSTQNLRRSLARGLPEAGGSRHDASSPALRLLSESRKLRFQTADNSMTSNVLGRSGRL